MGESRHSRISPLVSAKKAPSIKIPSLGAKSKPIDLGIEGLSVQICILYQGAMWATEARSKWNLLHQADKSKVFKLRAAQTRETAPELWEEDFRTEGFEDELIRHVQEYVMAGVSTVIGLEWTGRPSEETDDPNQILQILSALGWGALVRAYKIALEKQDLSDEQLFC